MYHDWRGGYHNQERVGCEDWERRDGLGGSYQNHCCHHCHCHHCDQPILSSVVLLVDGIHPEVEGGWT